MGVNSLFIFLTHKTRLIRQFLPKHMAEGSQADLPEHGEAQSGQKREPTSNGSRKTTSHSTTYMQESCTERNHIAHESIERARKGAYGPRGAQTNHASHTDRKACSDQKRISCTCAAPPGSHHMNACDDERQASDRIKQRAQWRGFKVICIPALSKRKLRVRIQRALRSSYERQYYVREDE